VLAWWGFTVVTSIVRPVAVMIGFLGQARSLRRWKRSGRAPALSISVALASYAVATYLVNMTFINRALAERGEAFRIGFPPQDAGLFFRVLSADFGVMDLVFLAIVVFEAWRIPKPLALPPGPAA
jgi:hypothetical protein